GHAPRRDEVQGVEGILGDVLVGLVVADDRAEEVGGEDFRRPEVPARKRALAGPRRADQDDERQLGNGDLHDPFPPSTSFSRRSTTPRCGFLRRTPGRAAFNRSTACGTSATIPRASRTAATTTAERPCPWAQWT